MVIYFLKQVVILLRLIKYLFEVFGEKCAVLIVTLTARLDIYKFARSFNVLRKLCIIIIGKFY